MARRSTLRIPKGYWVIIFPEGTRVAPNKKKKYLPGGGMLAEKSGAQVVPVAHNAGRLWSRNSMIKKPGLITIKIGPAIESENKNAKEITDEVENWIEKEVGELPG